MCKFFLLSNGPIDMNESIHQSIKQSSQVFSRSGSLDWLNFSRLHSSPLPLTRLTAAAASSSRCGRLLSVAKDSKWEKRVCPCFFARGRSFTIITAKQMQFFCLFLMHSTQLNLNPVASSCICTALWFGLSAITSCVDVPCHHTACNNEIQPWRPSMVGQTEGNWTSSWRHIASMHLQISTQISGHWGAGFFHFDLHNGSASQLLQMWWCTPWIGDCLPLLLTRFCILHLVWRLVGWMPLQQGACASTKDEGHSHLCDAMNIIPSIAPSGFVTGLQQILCHFCTFSHKTPQISILAPQSNELLWKCCCASFPVQCWKSCPKECFCSWSVQTLWQITICC